MQDSEKRIMWICSNCLRANISVDAIATWLFDKQEWEYGLCGGEGYCENCDEPTTAVNISLPISVWVELEKLNRGSIRSLIDYLYEDLSGIQFKYIVKHVREAMEVCSISPQDELVTLFEAGLTLQDL